MKNITALLYLCIVGLIANGCNTDKNSDCNNHISPTNEANRERLYKIREASKIVDPVFDRHVGYKEEYVTNTYKGICEIHVRPVKYFIGERYVKLKEKLKRTPSIPVKEILYRDSERIRIFWLLKQKEYWVVISDMQYPVGMQF